MPPVVPRAEHPEQKGNHAPMVPYAWPGRAVNLLAAAVAIGQAGA